VIPWRVKNFFSEHFPLLYHLLANAGTDGNGPEHWDARLAEIWDTPQLHWPSKVSLIASLTEPSDVVLDIGCGNGSILRDLRRRGYRNLHGLEISSYAIERLRTDGIEMHYGRLPRIPLPDEHFDVVIASQILEHVIRRRRLLTEMARVLRPGGRAFIFVPDNCLGPISEPEHVIKYDAESLARFVSDRFALVAIRSMRDINHAMPILFAHLRKPAS
jgi:ubiquinone/menaquinone biosynthesis C-methylase UbiE